MKKIIIILLLLLLLVFDMCCKMRRIRKPFTSLMITGQVSGLGKS